MPKIKSTKTTGGSDLAQNLQFTGLWMERRKKVNKQHQEKMLVNIRPQVGKNFPAENSGSSHKGKMVIGITLNIHASVKQVQLRKTTKTKKYSFKMSTSSQCMSKIWYVEVLCSFSQTNKNAVLSTVIWNTQH